MLTLDQAYRAAFLMADQYVALERKPDDGLVLFHQYLQTRPSAMGRLDGGRSPGDRRHPRG